MTRPAYPTSAVLGALALGGVLTLLTFRQGRLLTFDGYYYCETAKQFMTTWPDRFGNHWPVGYPLAGGLLARLGVPAYFALAALSTLALGTLLALAAPMLGGQPGRWLALAAIAGAPIVAPQLGGVLTELPFAAAWLGLAYSLSRWPARGALWGTAACAVVALCIRYAGLIALAAIAVWIVVQWPALGRARRRGEALAAGAVATTVSLGLLTINILRTGHASGAGRGGSLGLAALPSQLADFGWSLPSALVAGGLRDRIGAESGAGIAFGGALFLLLAALCLLAWRRPRSDFARPLALVTLGYATGMAVLRCVGEFDALHNARTFLPILAPTIMLAHEQLADRARWSMALCALVLAAGTLAGIRGISRQIGGDVRAAIAPVRERIAADDRIAVNDHAFAVSAYFAQPAIRALLGHWRQNPTERFVVVAGPPADRAGAGAACPADWVEFCAQLVTQGRYRYLVQEPQVIALERVATP